MVAPILGVLLGQLVGRGLGALESRGRQAAADKDRERQLTQFQTAMKLARGGRVETEDPVFGGPMAGGAEFIEGPDPLQSPENSARFGLNLAEQGYPQYGFPIAQQAQDRAANASGQGSQMLMKLLGIESAEDLANLREGGADRRAQLGADTRLEAAGIRASSADAQRRAAQLLGPPGQGMQRLQDPESLEFFDQPMVGSDEYVKRLEPVDQAGEALGVLGDQIAEINATGGESFGPSAARLAVRQARILSILGSLTNAGVLQVGEVERFERALQDPTAFFGVGANLSTETLTAPLEELQNMIRTRGQQTFQRNFRGQELPAYLIPPPPPGAQVQPGR